MKKLLTPMIKNVAKRYGLPPQLVYGVCMTESGLEPFATRYEVGYRWLYKPAEVRPETCSVETEVMFQKTSWGLMQVMGAVYRELGLPGWLTQVAGNPGLQLDYGCRHLIAKIEKYGTDAGIIAYNSGSPKKGASGKWANDNYLMKVLKFAQEWK